MIIKSYKNNTFPVKSQRKFISEICVENLYCSVSSVLTDRVFGIEARF